MKKILTIFTICLSLIATSCMNLFDKDESHGTYTITFDPNGGSGTVYTQTFEFGKKQKLKVLGFTPPSVGYSFAGWSEIKGSSGGTYTDEAEYPPRLESSLMSDRTFFAIWSNINQDTYVDGTGGSDDTGAGDGTSAKPYRTLNRIINEINRVNLPDLEWKVIIKNPIQGNVTIPHNLLGKLLITGETKDTNLATVSSGTVLTVESGSTVTLQSITISGGKPASASTVLRGGGIYNEGLLTVKTGTTITNNEATLGGGIYNAGTLIIESGCSIRSNTVKKAGGKGGIGSGLYSEKPYTGDADSVTSSNTPEPQVYEQPEN